MLVHDKRPADLAEHCLPLCSIHSPSRSSRLSYLATRPQFRASSPVLELEARRLDTTPHVHLGWAEASTKVRDAVVVGIHCQVLYEQDLIDFGTRRAVTSLWVGSEIWCRLTTQDEVQRMVPAIRAAPASQPISQEMCAGSADAFDGSDCDDAHLSDEEMVMDSGEKEVSSAPVHFQLPSKTVASEVLYSCRQVPSQCR